MAPTKKTTTAPKAKSSHPPFADMIKVSIVVESGRLCLLFASWLDGNTKSSHLFGINFRLDCRLLSISTAVISEMGG